MISAREEPSLEAFLPRRGDGLLSLSASDLTLYLTCPLKYKFARVFGIPQEPTINQRFGILIHNVLERFHKEPPEEGVDGLRVLNGLFESGWRRTGFGTSDDELQYRDRAREALRLYWERERVAESEPVWLERKFDFKVAEHHVRGRVDRVDRLPDGDYELIDYKTGERKTAADLDSDLQLALYRLAAREAWDIEAAFGSYYYVLDADKVAAPTKPDDAERVERTVVTVGEGILEPGLRAAPVAVGLQLVRLPPDLPGGGVVATPRPPRRFSGIRVQASGCLANRRRRAGAGTSGTHGSRSSRLTEARRRNFWNSRAIVEGRSSPSSRSTCSASIRSTSSSISGLAATARPICSS